MQSEPFTIADPQIAAVLQHEYGIHMAERTFLPLGHDTYSAVYRILDQHHQPYFLKIRIGAFPQTSLLIPRLLLEAGITNVLAPIRTCSGEITASMESYSVVLYPYIAGQNAMERGMTHTQWRVYGTALRAVHDYQLDPVIASQLPHETFQFPVGDRIAHLDQQLLNVQPQDQYQESFLRFWDRYRPQIISSVSHAKALGKQLQKLPFTNVLCHSDIHAANIMLADTGALYLIDWDSPLMAPRERDLLFVVGSIIARRVHPEEEQIFFETYGHMPINWQALGYYRYERAIEDIEVTGRSILIDGALSGPAIAEEIALMETFFQPGDILALAREAAEQME
jgi:spectinomycin phosphotransferase